MARITVLVCALGWTLTSCHAALGSVESYAAPILKGHEGVEVMELIKAVARSLGDQRWTAVQASCKTSAYGAACASRPNFFEAVSPVQDEVGVRMRERWFFLIELGRLHVERRLEAQFDTGPDAPWVSSAP